MKVRTKYEAFLLSHVSTKFIFCYFSERERERERELNNVLNYDKLKEIACLKRKKEEIRRRERKRKR